MCETSNRPACSRVHAVLGEDAVGVLHRHLVAGERHHARAERDVQRRRAACAERRRCLRPSDPVRSCTSNSADRPFRAPSVTGPERFPAANSAPVTPSVGRRDRPAAAFQSVARFARSSSPESFRGGCSFGARRPKSARSLPRGVEFDADRDNVRRRYSWSQNPRPSMRRLAQGLPAARLKARRQVVVGAVYREGRTRSSGVGRTFGSFGFFGFTGAGGGARTDRPAAAAAPAAITGSTSPFIWSHLPASKPM